MTASDQHHRLQHIDRMLDDVQQELRRVHGKDWMAAASACTFLRQARLSIELAIARLEEPQSPSQST
jgi:hypothetical protein